jgi:hypothetical protein
MRTRGHDYLRSLAVATVLVAALLLVPGSAFASRTLGLSAGSFLFGVAAGQQAAGEVIVMNDGTDPLKVMVYAADQTVDAKGNITYHAPTRAELSSLDLPSAWTQIKMPANSKSLGNIPYLELKPGQRVPVKFSIVVPSNVPPGDHNVILFFEAFEPPKLGQGAQSVVSGRLGARVTLRVQGDLVRKLEVRPFNVPTWVLGGAVPFDFTVRNIGNIDQRVGARVLLLDRNDNEVQRKQVLDGPTLFAGTNTEETGTLLADGPFVIGPYKVRLDVSPVDDTGKATSAGADTITETRDVWMIPFWVVALVIVIVVLIIVRIVWVIIARSKRRRAERDAQVAAAAVAAERQQSATAQPPRPFPDSEYEV